MSNPISHFDEEKYKEDILAMSQGLRVVECLHWMGVLNCGQLNNAERVGTQKRIAIILETGQEILDLALEREMTEEYGANPYVLRSLAEFIDPQDAKKKSDWAMEIIESDVWDHEKEQLVEAFFHGKDYANQSIQGVFAASSARMDQLVYGQDVTKLPQEVKTQLEKTLQKHHNYYHSKTTSLGDD